MVRTICSVTLTLLLLAMLWGCGGSAPSASGSQAPSEQTASRDASTAEGVAEEMANTTAEMPMIIERDVDPGVRVPMLPTPPTQMAEIQDDGRPMSNPPLRDDIFTSGEYGGRLVIGTLGDPKTFNVMTANESSSTDIINRMWTALLNYNNVTQQVVPGLAESWEHNEEGNEWTFHLREGLVFSDGSPLTSEAVDRYFRVIYTDELVNPDADIMNIDGERFTWETPDPLTVIIRTPDVFAQMPLQANNIKPLPAHPWEEALQSENPAEALALIHSLDVDPATYVCSGPYMLESFTSGETTVLRRNPNFQMWDANGRRLPNLDEVVFVNVPDLNALRLRFEAGETDELNPIMPNQYVALRDGAEEGDWTVWDLGPTLGKGFFWFNLKEGVSAETGEPYVDPIKAAWFQNVIFRRACAHAIDRESMVDIVYNGRATPKIAFESISNIFWCNRDAPRYDYDPERAMEMLDSIGFIDRDGDGVREDPEGNPIRFTMITNRGNDVRERLIVLIQEDLAAIGIDMTPSNIEFNALVTRISDSYVYEACLLGLGGGTPDPTTGLNVLRSSGRTHLWNPSQATPATEAEARIDALCDHLVTTLDTEEQRRIYFEIQDIIGEECFAIWTVDANAYAATGNRLGNWLPAIVDPKTTWNIESITQLSAH